MKIVNLIWGFSLGGGGKCFLTYAGLGEVEPRLTIHSVCVNLLSEPVALDALSAIGASRIDIQNRYDLSWLPRCRDLFLRETPDAIFTHGFNGPVVAQAVCHLYGLQVPMLCSYHGPYHPPRFSRRFMAPVFNAATYLLYRFAAQGIMTVAECCKQDLVRHGVPADRVSVINNGIDPRPQRASMPRTELLPGGFASAGSVVVGIVSRLDRVKGLGFLMEAVAQTVRDGVNLKLVMIGDGPERSALENTAARLGLAGDVLFVGQQTNVTEWLERLDIFALPSLSEAHSISLLEAMRAGLAIVATRVGGNPESVRDEQEALLVRPADAGALSAALARLARDVGLRRKLGNAARQRFHEQFTMALMRRRLADWLLRFESGSPLAR